MGLMILLGGGILSLAFSAYEKTQVNAQEITAVKTNEENHFQEVQRSLKRIENAIYKLSK